MTITTQAGFFAALDMGTKQRFVISKATVTAVTGGQSSFWRSAGLPVAAAAAPTTAAICDNTTSGALPFRNPASGQNTIVAKWQMLCSAVSSVELHDRLAHSGALDGTVVTAQTVGIDLGAMTASNFVARMGSSYAMVQWYFEWYTATGATTTTATVAYMDQNNAAQTTTVTIPASPAAGRLVQIVPTIAGSYIRAITNITLAATTGTAGAFGVTATVEKTNIAFPIGSLLYDFNLGPVAPGIPDSACLFMIGNATTTGTGSINGLLLLAQG